MNDSEFHVLADQEMYAIEQAIDDSGADIDYETTAGIMTLEFADDTKIIINRQEPLHQIWVAARSGGHHLAYENEQWVDDRSGEELYTMLSRLCSEQAGEPVTLTRPAE